MSKRTGRQFRKKIESQTLVLTTLLILLIGLGVFGVVANTVKTDSVLSSDVYSFSYESQPMLGNQNAPVKILEFGDFKCPACKAWEEQIFPRLKAEYIDSGKAVFYFMNNPVLGDDSWTAAIAGESVFRQNPTKFWEYYQAVYRHQKDEKTKWATPEFLSDLVKQEVPGIDAEKVLHDAKMSVYKEEVTRNKEQANQAGASSTPSIFINGRKLEKFYDYSAIRAAIEEELKKTR